MGVGLPSRDKKEDNVNYITEIIARSGNGYVTKKYRLPSGQVQFIIRRPNAPKSSGYLIRVEDDTDKCTNIYEFVDDNFGALLRATADGEMIARAQMIAVDAFEGSLTQDAVFKFCSEWENFI